MQSDRFLMLKLENTRIPAMVSAHMAVEVWSPPWFQHTWP